MTNPNQPQNASSKAGQLDPKKSQSQQDTTKKNPQVSSDQQNRDKKSGNY